MNWFHRVDPTWLAERKQYLTASDIKKLIPVTATGRTRSNMAEAYLKAWADKQCEISEDDLISSGAMGRGHWLETYAIREFNKLGVVDELFHWDNMLVHSLDGVSTSPDAMDIPMPTGVGVSVQVCSATVLGEVKSYNGPAHYQAGIGQSKLTLEERWQLAVAMYVVPTIETAALILFNPSARHPLFYHLYTPAELKDELDMISQVVLDWSTITPSFDQSADVQCPSTVKEACVTEADIMAEVIELTMPEPDSRLNP